MKSTHLWALGLKCTSPSEWNSCRSLSPHTEPLQKFLRLRMGCYLFEANGSALKAHCSSISHSMSQTLKSVLLMSRNYPYNFSQYTKKQVQLIYWEYFPMFPSYWFMAGTDIPDNRIRNLTKDVVENPKDFVFLPVASPFLASRVMTLKKEDCSSSKWTARKE